MKIKHTILMILAVFFLWGVAFAVVDELDNDSDGLIDPGLTGDDVTTYAFTTEGDITDPITTKTLLLDGDNDADNDTIDLQDGAYAGQLVHFIAYADIDSTDTVTIAMTDTTCVGCPTITFDTLGDGATLRWTALGWNVLAVYDSGQVISDKLENIVADTTPQLGGNLDLNNKFLYEAFNAFSDADATPDVSDGTIFKTANTGATIITDFDAGGGALTEGQIIFVLINDGNTTVDFTASGLKGHSGVDWSPAANDSLIGVYDGTDWNCIVSRYSKFENVVYGGFGASKLIESDASGNLQDWSGALAMNTTGIITGKFDDESSSAATLDIAAATHYGGVAVNGDADAQTQQLDAAVVGMSIVSVDNAGGAITLDPNGNDTIVLDGTSAAAGEAIISSGAKGDFASLICLTANQWIVLGHDANGWTEATP